MSFESDLISIVGADSGVTALISTNFYAVSAEEQRPRPYAVYEVIASFPAASRESDSTEINCYVIQIGSYGTDLANSKQIARAIRSCILDDFQASVIEDTHDERDPDTRELFQVQTFRIWHSEAIA